MLLQSFCISQKVTNLNTDSLTFSISLDSSTKGGLLSLITTLKNNTNHTLIFISETCPNNIIYVIDNPELRLASYDCSSTDHPIKITLLPFASFKDVIDVYPPLKYPQTNFKGNFRVGFKYLKSNKTENIKKKALRLSKTNNIIWSNTIKMGI